MMIMKLSPVQRNRDFQGIFVVVHSSASSSACSTPALPRMPRFRHWCFSMRLTDRLTPGYWRNPDGKTELRVCDGVATLDKRHYDVLPARTDHWRCAGAYADGTLTLRMDGAKAICVFTKRIKFDKSPDSRPRRLLTRL